MLFSLTEEVEPVHVLKVNIWTRKAEEDLKLMKEVENKLIKKIPDFNLDDFETISHSKDNKCIYRNLDFDYKLEKK